MAEYEVTRFGTPDYLECSRCRNFSFPAHYHRCLELIIMVEGSTTLLVQAARHPLHAGELALFLPNELHGFETQGDSLFSSVIFPPERVASFMKLTENRMPSRPVFRPAEAYLADALHHFEAWMRSPLKTDALLLLACACFQEQVEWVRKGNRNPELAYRIIDHIGRNRQEDLNLRMVADALGYSPAYLSRYMSRHMHTSFHDYLTNLRLADAAMHLERTEWKIVDIAMQSGFACLRTFNGLFRRTYGMSPQAYRRHMVRERDAQGTASGAPCGAEAVP